MFILICLYINMFNIIVACQKNNTRATVCWTQWFYWRLNRRSTIAFGLIDTISTPSRHHLNSQRRVWREEKNGGRRRPCIRVLLFFDTTLLTPTAPSRSPFFPNQAPPQRSNLHSIVCTSKRPHAPNNVQPVSEYRKEVETKSLETLDIQNIES